MWHLLPVNIGIWSIEYVFFYSKNDFYLKSIIIEFTNIEYYNYI